MLCGPCRSVKPSSASKILYNATLTCLREKSASGVLKGQNIPLTGIQSILKSEWPYVRSTSHVLQAPRSSSTKLRLVVDIKCGTRYTKCRETFQHLVVPISTCFFLTFRMNWNISFLPSPDLVKYPRVARDNEYGLLFPLGVLVGNMRSTPGLISWRSKRFHWLTILL